MTPVQVDVGTHRLRIASDGQGPPHVLCLHGLADTLEIWSRVAALLAARGQVILVDQRAHGESDAPPGPYRREDLAADVCAVLDWCQVARAILVGHSLGGIVAMTAALAAPERVAGLVLVGTASQCSPRVAGWYERIARAAETDGIPGFLRAIYGEGARRRLRGDAQGLAHVTRALESLADDPLTSRLAAVRCPVAVLVGAKDPMGQGPSVVVSWALPHATLEVIPERGHWLHVEAPDVVVAAVDRLLACPGLVCPAGVHEKETP